MIIGFDPGGNSGIPVLSKLENGDYLGEVATLRSVNEAFRWVSDRGSNGVAAAGIDTLLSWSTTTSGWRPMDLFLRGKFQEVANSVAASNSLYGAMGIQGMCMALLLRKQWPGIVLNETHPKVHYYSETHSRYEFRSAMIDWLRRRFSWEEFPIIENEHEWDALYSAIVTELALSRDRATDLIEETNARSALLFPAGPSNYFWI